MQDEHQSKMAIRKEVATIRLYLRQALRISKHIGQPHRFLGFTIWQISISSGTSKTCKRIRLSEITNGDKVLTLTENQSTYIPLGTVHRLSNPGTIPLEIIEVQSGSYLGEDDIVRFEDRYGR